MKKNNNLKILINTSNLYVGGGLQVAVSFINELKKISTDHKYYIFLSKAVDLQIIQSSFTDNFKFYLIEKSPASLTSRKKIVARLNELEADIQPDVVFTIFGPSYWRPKSKHIMGFAIPGLINPRSIALSQLTITGRFQALLKRIYNKYHVKRNADYYVVESLDTKNKLSHVLSLPLEKIDVIGNTVSEIYYKDILQHYAMPDKLVGEFRLITISHNYPHKNLKIIKDIVPYLKILDQSVRFFVTIDDISYKKLFSGLEKYVVNLGPVKIKECPSIYQQCDAMFLPTLLECFSASYPEAMKMGKPILTSNYSFAVDICDDAAIYFNPLDPKEIAEKIILLIKNKNIYLNLVEKGQVRLKSFETSRSRAEKYLVLCETGGKNIIG